MERPRSTLKLFTFLRLRVNSLLLGAVKQTCSIFEEQVGFSYGESPRAPPLEGTSLHRRNKERGETLGDLEPVSDLSTVKSEFTLEEAVTQTYIVERVVFLTVNHRGPLSSREFHSTDEISVWRDPGRS